MRITLKFLDCRAKKPTVLRRILVHMEAILLIKAPPRSDRRIAAMSWQRTGTSKVLHRRPERWVAGPQLNIQIRRANENMFIIILREISDRGGANIFVGSSLPAFLESPQIADRGPA
jgi:hypothetical protein